MLFRVGGRTSHAIHLAYPPFTRAQNSILTLLPTRKYPWCLHDHELGVPPGNLPSVYFLDKDREKAFEYHAIPYR